MKTRSAKAAGRRQQIFSLDSQDTAPDTSDSRKRRASDGESFKERRGRTSKRKSPDADDLEEERVKPSKADYNNVRRALILAREEGHRKDAALKQKDAAMGELAQEIEERDRTVTEKEYLLLKCSEIHDKIREIQDAGSTLRLMDHDLSRRGDFSGAGPAITGDASSPNPTGSVKEMLMRLRTSIHKFANEYFSGKLQIPSVAQLGAGWAHQYMQATTPGEETYLDYLRSRHRCPMIIEAFLWRFLCGIVFNGVPWGGSETIRHHVSGLQDLLARCKSALDLEAFSTEELIIFDIVHNSPHSTPKQIKLYQEWRRQTTELVLQMHHANTAPADLHLSQLEESFSTSISDVIVPFTRSSPVGHKDELNKIIRQAIALDMEMSRQLPRYTWRFSNTLVETPFNFCLGQENVMKLHLDEKTASELLVNMKARVYLVVAPGLTQRGLDNSPSTPFEEEYWVVPMEVTCVRPRRQKRFGPTYDGSDATVE